VDSDAKVLLKLILILVDKVIIIIFIGIKLLILISLLKVRKFFVTEHLVVLIVGFVIGLFLCLLNKSSLRVYLRFASLLGREVKAASGTAVAELRAGFQLFFVKVDH